jgi:hypothetical protein
MFSDSASYPHLALPSLRAQFVIVFGLGILPNHLWIAGQSARHGYARTPTWVRVSLSARHRELY